jgi:hypothetical protein
MPKLKINFTAKVGPLKFSAAVRLNACLAADKNEAPLEKHCGPVLLLLP